MVEIVKEDAGVSLQKYGNSYALIFPKEWLDISGIDPEEDDVVRALLHSPKHGYHIGGWRDGEQPKRTE